MSRSVARFCEVALRNVYYLELRRDRACTNSAHRASTAATNTRAGLASVLQLLAIISGANFFEQFGAVRAVWAPRTVDTRSQDSRAPHI